MPFIFKLLPVNFMWGIWIALNYIVAQFQLACVIHLYLNY